MSSEIKVSEKYEDGIIKFTFRKSFGLEDISKEEDPTPANPKFKPVYDKAYYVTKERGFVGRKARFQSSVITRYWRRKAYYFFSLTLEMEPSQSNN